MAGIEQPVDVAVDVVKEVAKQEVFSGRDGRDGRKECGVKRAW